MFTVLFPQGCTKGRSYVIDFIFKEIFGLDCTGQPADIDSVIIRHGEKTLELPDTFFSRARERWLHPSTLPEVPHRTWDISGLKLDAVVTDSRIPILYGHGGYELHGNHCRLDFDIFGSVFFILSGYEELVKTERDEHGRFPGSASLAYQEGFLNRPIINEYIELLLAFLKMLWPQVQGKKRSFRKLISCDVDFPYGQSGKSLTRLFRQFYGDIFNRADAGLAVSNLKSFMRVRSRGDYTLDPHFTFDWMMDIAERSQVKIAFYFICPDSRLPEDGYYSLVTDSVLRGLMRRIHERGHEIGLHGSYGSYRDSHKLSREVSTLKTVMKEEGIDQPCLGGRQHFLRWDTAATPRVLSEAGLTYDSTLTFPEEPGFRRGVCYEYPLFDLMSRCVLPVRERPLVAMENAFFNNAKRGKKSVNMMRRKLFELLETCKLFSGDFTLLWHNNQFYTSDLRRLYADVLSA